MQYMNNNIFFGITILIAIGYCFFGSKYSKLLLSTNLFVILTGTLLLKASLSWTQTAIICGIGVLLIAGVLLSDTITGFLLGMVGTYQIIMLFYTPTLTLGAMQWNDYLILVVCVLTGIGVVLNAPNMLPIITAMMGAKTLGVVVIFMATQFQQLYDLFLGSSTEIVFSVQQQITKTLEQYFWPTLCMIFVLAALGIKTQMHSTTTKNF